MADKKTFMIEGAQLIFLNLAGKEGPMNREGDRNFCVILTPELAEQLINDGWNVKFLQPRDEGDAETPYIQVAVSYKNRPPRVILITSASRTQLSDSQVEILDYADIETVDLIATGYDWTVGDKSGTKAYLQSMFVTIREDALERKYRIHEDPPTVSED